MHAGLLAAPGDGGAAGRLDDTRADEEALLALFAVAHVLGPQVEVVQFFPGGVARSVIWFGEGCSNPSRRADKRCFS